MLLALEQRFATDERTMGELFLLVVDELDDISFSQSLQLIFAAMIDSVCAVFHPTEEQIDNLTENFISRLPQRYQTLLSLN